MGLRDQTSIGLTPTEKEELIKAKRSYEESTGDRTDWGKFLGVAAGITLAVIGLNKIVQSDRRKPIVECPECSNTFTVAYMDKLPPVAHVRCPECSEEVLVRFM
ncbi:hypothetical protein ACFLU4_04585 [Chloroflexota bacterium]